MDDGQVILAQPPVTLPAPPAPDHFKGHATEGFTTVGGEEFYCIPGYDELRPFLMSIVSDGDLWMFVSSRGGLTAGRCSPDRAIFAYETDDRLHHLHGITGPVTLIRADDSSDTWEPFTSFRAPGIRRNLYKSATGNALVFEEVNAPLGLTFRYAWQNCHRFGFVRTSTLINHSPSNGRSIELIDGLLNLQPAGVALRQQQASSCLVDAYKCAEVDRETRLAIFSLSALVSDRPEPAECLRGTVAWSRGLSSYRVLLSDRQIDSFRRGMPIRAELRLRGERSSFLVASTLQLRPGQALSWDIAVDTHLSQSDVTGLRRWLGSEPRPNEALRRQIDLGTQNLRRLVAAADGLQRTSHRTTDHHHFANTLFNVMRGGVICDDGRIRRDDLLRFVRSRNLPVAATHAGLLASQPEMSRADELHRLAESTSDVDLQRLVLEYLPLTFARRHGDPSRPWNLFAIRAFNDDGSRAMDYAGNWRDIFQNWEALCCSFPDYLPHVVAKFVNATTVDGFNAYRLGRDGIDWETPDPEDPWSNIGYWGDHQIAYLTCFLEASRHAHNGWLTRALHRPMFSYADVPYRLKSFDQMLCDPRNTIVFDRGLHDSAMARVGAVGADGRLVRDGDGRILHASLVEKLLVSVLAKLGSLVPGGGIWMSTQRPEWNDANNALAAHGLSVVTACYLYRHLGVIIDLLGSSPEPSASVHDVVGDWMRATASALEAERVQFAALGEAFSRYRARVYRTGLGTIQNLPVDEIIRCLSGARVVLEATIRQNQRADGLFHAYNLLRLPPSAAADRVSIERLPEMLEGQVAVIASGVLSSTEVLAVVHAIFKSRLFRADQNSLMLYPDAPAAGFLLKNVAPRDDISRIDLLTRMLADGDRRIIERDADGALRFNPDIRNDSDLCRRLDALHHEPRWAEAVERDKRAVRDTYEATFHHHAFTGRSQSMFGYEGLGCIYWHMVAKLLLATQQQYFRALDRNEPGDTISALADAYDRIRGGLGFNKTAREYGAFPTDPYSHTPGHAGARQPGMTGQVKEEILTRLGELGVRVVNGRVRFRPTLLSTADFLDHASEYVHLGRDGEPATLPLGENALAFSYCGVPVVYRLDASGPRTIVLRRGGPHEVIPGDWLGEEASRALLQRTGEVERLLVAVHPSSLRNKPEARARFHHENHKNNTAAGAAGGIESQTINMRPADVGEPTTVESQEEER